MMMLVLGVAMVMVIKLIITYIPMQKPHFFVEYCEAMYVLSVCRNELRKYGTQMPGLRFGLPDHQTTLWSSNGLANALVV